MQTPRFASQNLTDSLDGQACDTLIGPRQVCKTPLALRGSKETDSTHLDLERQSDRLVSQDPDYIFFHNLETNWLFLMKSIERQKYSVKYEQKWIWTGIAIKRSVAACTKTGFHIAKTDIGANRCFVVHTSDDRVPLSH